MKWKIAAGVVALAVGSGLMIGVGWLAFNVMPIVAKQIGEGTTLSLMFIATVLPFSKWIGEGFLSIRR